MQSRVEVGHVGRFWDDSFKLLPFTKQPVTQQEIDEWKTLGYNQSNVKSFTGSMYDNRNPMPEYFDQFENVFGLYKQSFTVYRMDTLEIMPVHSDHYRTYCRLNDVDYNEVYRVVLMLEDWKPGHYFELDGVGYVNWKAGDWFKWKGDVPHAASNIGVESRYTLQVTGVSSLVGQLNCLYSYNVPGYVSDNNNPIIKLDIQPKIHDKHYMVYLNNGFIKELNTIDHTIEEQKLLNDEGLHIYLYEPLNSYDVDKFDEHGHTQGFYSEFNTINSDKLRAEELDSIVHYAIRNNLKNVTVHTCDYNVSEYYTEYNKLTLLCDDLFLKTQRKIINLIEKPSHHFIKNYMCLNWRFTKHRQLVSTFLAGMNGHLSWYYKADFDTLKKDLFFDLDSWETKHPEHYNKLIAGCKLIEQHGPYKIDKHDATVIKVEDPSYVKIYPSVDNINYGETPALHNRVSNNLSNYYHEIFVDIVNETRYAQPTANFSEKVFQAIQYMKPFILVAPPKTLEYIRSMGYKTFGEFWDESYDDELDHGERLAKIFDLINQICSMTNDQQKELYVQMLPTIEHNLKLYKEMVK